MECITFVREYLRAPGRVGALMPSSKALARLMVDTALANHPKVVVEFGAGTGVFTELLAQRLNNDAAFLTMEINEHLAQQTQRRCPGVRVIHDSAVNAPQYLKDMGLTHCDCIVSGLPWASFNDELQDSLLSTVESLLEAGGRFTTFTYLLSPYLKAGRIFRKKLEKRFCIVKTSPVVWRNFPPAFIYCVDRLS